MAGWAWMAGGCAIIGVLAAGSAPAHAECFYTPEGIRMCSQGGSSSDGGGGGWGSSRAEREAERAWEAEQERAYDDAHARAQAAWESQNWSEALRLLKEQQRLRDGPNVRQSIAEVERYLSDVARNNEANSLIAAGDSANKNHDYRTALELYQRALQTAPYPAAGLKEFVPRYEQFVRSWEVQSKGVASIIQTVSQTPSASAGNAPGLSFMTGDRPTGSPPGPNTSAGDQLRAAAAAARAGGPDPLRKSFDAGGATYAGSIVYARGGGVDMSGWSARARNDTEILAAVKELQTLQAQRSRVQAERDALVKQRNAAPDAATMQKLGEQLDRKEEVLQNQLVQIAAKEEGIEKRRRFVDATVADEPPKSAAGAAK